MTIIFEPKFGIGDVVSLRVNPERKRDRISGGSVTHWKRLYETKRLNDRYLESGIVPAYWIGYSEVVKIEK